MIASEISRNPSLQIATADIEIAGRINELDTKIHTDPAEFMVACRQLGGKATEYMTGPPLLEKAAPTTVDKLRTFLSRNDLLRADFDPQSTEAIYDDEGVMTMIRKLNNQKASVRKSERDDTKGQQLLSDTSALKLYFFAARVKQRNAERLIKSQVRHTAA